MYKKRKTFFKNSNEFVGFFIFMTFIYCICTYLNTNENDIVDEIKNESRILEEKLYENDESDKISNENTIQEEKLYENTSIEDKNNNSRKEYTTNSEEYINYIWLTAQNSIPQDSLFKSLEYRTRYGCYIEIWYHTERSVDKEKLDKEIKLIIENMYNELRKNDYKKLGWPYVNYEYINLYFWNVEKNVNEIYDWTQIKINEIND